MTDLCCAQGRTQRWLEVVSPWLVSNKPFTQRTRWTQRNSLQEDTLLKPVLFWELATVLEVRMAVPCQRGASSTLAGQCLRWQCCPVKLPHPEMLLVTPFKKMFYFKTLHRKTLHIPPRSQLRKWLLNMRKKKSDLSTDKRSQAWESISLAISCTLNNLWKNQEWGVLRDA